VIPNVQYEEESNMPRTSTLIRRISALVITGLLLAGLVATTSAHETREVEGEFEFVVGFMNEPAYVNEMNGLDLRIFYLNGDGHSDDGDESDDQYASDAEPVENAHETLRAAIQFGGESHELDLRAVWGQPGHYTADVIPTATGAYTFQITGEIDGVQVNETFSAGPDTFSEIESRDELEFPASSGSSSSDTNQIAAFGIAGVVAGLLGLVAGGAAYYKVSNPGGAKMNPAQRRREQQKAQQQKQRNDQET
jgi:hypothetical protein